MAGSRWRPTPLFDLQAFRSGDLTPVFFGSALRSIGVEQLLDGLADYGPPPQPSRRGRSPLTPLSRG